MAVAVAMLDTCHTCTQRHAVISSRSILDFEDRAGAEHCTEPSNGKTKIPRHGSDIKSLRGTFLFWRIRE